ncbi:carbohydrate ABC transporter permease [Paenibacillus daejeonensis]|uniref:carbohydrate ABC transporter permease n=1 Tax=Paenibacillus daejeonensis TaxID=135193 RepID=UPI00037BE876|nr:carbohydrate ABC transporter permease [Paenibacillus daejeonensis]
MKKYLLTLLMAGLGLVILFPLIVTVVNSLTSRQEIALNYASVGSGSSGAAFTEFVNLKLIPDQVSYEQYITLLVESPRFLLMFWNSVFMVVPIIIGQTVVASLASYALSKLQFRGREPIFLVYLLTMLMPFQVTLVPNYLIADKMGLLNHVSAIIWPGVFAAFGVFLLRQFMMQIPYAYIEAGKLDGAGHLLIFLKIIVPMIKPGFSALVILLFVDYWNMIEQPLIFLDDPFMQPLSIYLSRINEGELGIAFAASVLYMAPMVLLFLYAESYLVQGVQLSGIKG